MRGRSEVLSESGRRDCSHQRQDEATESHLVCTERERKLEDDSAVIILLASRFEIEISQSNFPRMSWSQIEKSRAHDRVVPHFLLASVFVHQESRIRGGRGICIRGTYGSGLGAVRACHSPAGHRSAPRTRDGRKSWDRLDIPIQCLLSRAHRQVHCRLHKGRGTDTHREVAHSFPDDDASADHRESAVVALGFAQGSKTWPVDLARIREVPAN